MYIYMYSGQIQSATLSPYIACTYIFTHTHTHPHTYIYTIHVCTYICMYSGQIQSATLSPYIACTYACARMGASKDTRTS